MSCSNCLLAAGHAGDAQTHLAGPGLAQARPGASSARVSLASGICTRNVPDLRSLQMASMAWVSRPAKKIPCQYAVSLNYVTTRP